ncbi:MAG: CDP-alcohol phosphatidyltransferase family protein [Euryarchaeota archaeon]|nr:CDP-alcohol phosphatidyltransferase family protein [Euryarchaeota archaeon]
MVLDEYREDADAVLDPVAKQMLDTHPDTLTWTSLFCAILAGAFFALSMYGEWLLGLGAIFVFLNGVLDALDGKIAKMSGRASKRGDMLDHVVDRYADFFMIGGIMLSPYSRHMIIGLAALLGVFMTSYMGTQAQAVGAKRDYSGVLGRADRLALLIAMPLIQLMLITLLLPSEIPLPAPFQLNLIEIMLIWFAIAGNLTAVQRGLRAWRSLK